MKVDGSGLSAKAQMAMKIMDEIRGKEVALAEQFLNVIRDRTPVGKSTWGERTEPSGGTQKSWTVHVLQNDVHGVRWQINPEGHEDIVTFLEFGTAPHVITPKNPGGVLVFEVGGETVFARIVHHPGTKPLGIVRITQGEIDGEGKRLVSDLHARMRSLPH